MSFNPFKPSRPNQTPIPSQAPARNAPYSPGRGQADFAGVGELQRQHAPGFGGQPPTFVVSTFDARPINGVDFQVQSGDDLAAADGFSDIGYAPTEFAAPIDAYFRSSVFYKVGPSRVAIVRQFQILCLPARGTDQYALAGQPILNTLGASNFYYDFSILLNGVYQEGMAGVRSFGGAFGDVFGSCYVVANEGDIIEFRIEAPEDGGSRWYQALLSMAGNLIFANGSEPQFAPGTQQAIPVHENGSTKLKGVV